MYVLTFICWASTPRSINKADELLHPVVSYLRYDYTQEKQPSFFIPITTICEVVEDSQMRNKAIMRFLNVPILSRTAVQKYEFFLLWHLFFIYCTKLYTTRGQFLNIWRDKTTFSFAFYEIVLRKHKHP